MSRVTIAEIRMMVEEMAEKMHTSIGNKKGQIYLAQAYGGYKVVEVVNDGGAILDITSGFVSKDRVHDQICHVITGINYCDNRRK